MYVLARLRKQWYDYTNKRQRLDRDDGTTKMYDYKTLVDPCPVGQCPSSRPKFPSPQGFKWQTDDMDNTCCFVSPVSGYGMSNSTFSDFTTTIDPTVFDHPDSRVTFGKCKECGVDDECPMWQCMQ